jgi:hypothetical protein
MIKTRRILWLALLVLLYGTYGFSESHRLEKQPSDDSSVKGEGEHPRMGPLGCSVAAYHSNSYENSLDILKQILSKTKNYKNLNVDPSFTRGPAWQGGTTVYFTATDEKGQKFSGWFKKSRPGYGPAEELTRHYVMGYPWGQLVQTWEVFHLDDADGKEVASVSEADGFKINGCFSLSEKNDQG